MAKYVDLGLKHVDGYQDKSVPKVLKKCSLQGVTAELVVFVVKASTSAVIGYNPTETQPPAIGHLFKIRWKVFNHSNHCI